MRHCPKCNKDLEDHLFKKKANGSYQAYCIECKRVIDREYQARKRAEKLAQTKNETVSSEKETVLTEIETVSSEIETETVKDYQKVIYCPCDDWIPIEDRLPDHAGVYLITQLGSNTFEQSSKGVKVPVVNECTFLPGGFLNSNVQAWRPVPEPYKHVKPTITPAPWYKSVDLGYKDKNDEIIREGAILDPRGLADFCNQPLVIYWDKRSLKFSICRLYEMHTDTHHGIQIAWISRSLVIGSIYNKKDVINRILTDQYFNDSYELEKAKKYWSM